jgi:nitrous oxidase accessory protein
VARLRRFLPGVLMGAFSLLVTAQEEIGWRGEVSGGETPKLGATADMTNAPRVEVDRPKPRFALYERDKRVHGLRPFQELVDAAPEGSVLNPPPGRYSGPVFVNKKLVIEGGGQVVIDGGDKGTVFSIEANDVVLRGVRLTGSGESHDTDDGCLDVRGHRVVIENNRMDNCLFGIDLKQVNKAVIRNNTVTSKPFDLGVRGDGLRLWYSNDNLVEGNTVTDSRDMVAWYSHRNVFRGNVGMRSRYSIHFMFANHNTVEGNKFYDNSVGIYFMYTEGGAARNNLISHATGAAGMAVGFKEASDIDIEGNEIIYCAIGVGSDLSPFQPNTTIRFKNNRIAYNGIGFQFTSEIGGNVAAGNIFEGNLNHVIQAGRGTANLNRWEGNYWDDYQGFDRNGDGIGDTTYELYAYADQLWMEMPVARFFKTSPVLELIDFLERLAPFSTPEMQAKDERPLFGKPPHPTAGRIS